MSSVQIAWKPTSESRKNRNLIVGDHSFEVVNDFIYFGSLVNHNSDMSLGIKRRLITANQTYYGLKKQLSSQVLTRAAEAQLYKTLILLVLVYGSEAWTLKNKDNFEKNTGRYARTNSGEDDTTMSFSTSKEKRTS